MDEKFKNKLVKALRSGRYKQGKAALYDRRDDTYCCLGVACKIARIKPVYESKDVDNPSFHGDNVCLSNAAKKYTTFKTMTGFLELTDEEFKWLKEKHPNADRSGGISQKTGLAHLNDNDVSFHDIATLIENHWEEL